jgi:hypothetical protein
MATAQSPIKVYEDTKDKIRYAAAVHGCTQTEFVAKAVDEYVEHHRADFVERIEDARAALLGGPHDAVAYALGVSREDVDRVAGSPRG